jgi:hypothetical protein
MTEDLVPTGTYWDQQTWELARSAYIADLDTDPTGPDSFVGWLHRALDEHSAQTPATRSRMAEATTADTTTKERGFSKTYPLKASTVDALEGAIVDDRQEVGRVVSRSGFLREAVQAAARLARDRYGRDLPPPPARLPNRPPRRPAVSGSVRSRSAETARPTTRL